MADAVHITTAPASNIIAFPDPNERVRRSEDRAWDLASRLFCCASDFCGLTEKEFSLAAGMACAMLGGSNV